jgi:hypothetical protein
MRERERKRERVYVKIMSAPALRIATRLSIATAR